MEARSYLENIANRTTMRAVILTMTEVLGVALVVGAVALVALTGAHPAALVIGLVMLVGAVVMGRDSVVNRREAAANPLDLAFDPAPRGGLVSPGTVFGLAGALVLFGVVLGAVSWFGGGGLPLWAWVCAGVGVVLAVVGVPTLGVEDRKWRVLADALRAHPRLIPYLQDARARFPRDAPFPFSAPTDEVTIP